MADFVAKLTAPRAAWVMVPAGDITGKTIEELAAHDGSRATRSSTAATPTTATTSAAPPSSPSRGIHLVDCGTSGGVWGLDRGYCLMIGGETGVVERLEPDLRAPSPRASTPRRAPRAGPGAPEPAEQGYLHCGPNGAGHFVKMVHNGIEYGMMASFAEGLNILRNANAGKQATARRRRDRADGSSRSSTSSTSTPPRSPRCGAAAASSGPGCST